MFLYLEYKFLTLHNQANSGAYYIIQKDFMHFSLKNHFASGFSFINNLIDRFHTSCSQNEKWPKTNFKSFLFTDINEYYSGL